MRCLICGKWVDPKDDAFVQYTVTSHTICKECKASLEAREMQTKEGEHAK